MRIILRIVAVAIWFAIIGTLLLIWRFWRFGDLATLWASGIFGLITFLGWLLTLTVGLSREFNCGVCGKVAESLPCFWPDAPCCTTL